MQRTNIKIFFHAIIFIVILILVLGQIADIMVDRLEKNRWKTFFDQPEEYDVLFVGTSHVYCSIYPMELFNDYGIASCDFSFSACKIPTMYYTLVEALEYASPKVVAIDLYYLSSNEKFDERYIHSTLASYPLSYSKFLTVNDLFENKDEKIEGLFTLAKYHDRWVKLGQPDFTPERNYHKGAEVRTQVFINNINQSCIDKSVLPNDYTVGMEYLEKAIELCQSKGIEVLLTGIPYPMSEEEQIYFNYGYVLAEKYNIRYLDLINTEIVNYTTDLSNESHLNSSGAYKITSYVGDYIINNYNLPDRRKDETYNSWKDDFQKCINLNIASLSTKAEIYEYLIALNYNAFECSISLSNKITEEKYPLIYEFINNINDIYECDQEIVFGYFKVYSNVSNKNEIITNNERSDINIIVYSKDTGDIISKANFNIQESNNIVKK